MLVELWNMGVEGELNNKRKLDRFSTSIGTIEGLQGVDYGDD